MLEVKLFTIESLAIYGVYGSL